MLNTFLDKATLFLDRRFFVTSWFPALMTLAAALFLRAWTFGLANTWVWWQSLGPAPDQEIGDYAQLWILLAVLLLVTLVAYLLQALARPLVQLYEGYWPLGLRRWAARRVSKRWQRLRALRVQSARSGDSAAYAALQDTLHHRYPPREEALLPTRLGNVLRAAEQYGATSYGMDVVFWWPRLWSVLPAEAQARIGDALTPMLALLNVATLSAGLGIGGAIYLARAQIVWWQWLLVLLGGTLVSWLAYQGAVAQARSYGQLVRAGIDLWRFSLLQALHQPLPATPQEERVLWRKLAAWLYNQDRGMAQKLAYLHEDEAPLGTPPQEGSQEHP
jgi:hypothetical protein